MAACLRRFCPHCVLGWRSVWGAVNPMGALCPLLFTVFSSYGLAIIVDTLYHTIIGLFVCLAADDFHHNGSLLLVLYFKKISY